MENFKSLELRGIKEVLGFCGCKDTISIEDYTSTNLTRWSYEKLDLPIISALIEAVRPKRHLEFGTWEGRGVACVLSATDATVWTINLPQGEDLMDGSWAYGSRVTAEAENRMNGVISMHTGVDPDGTPRIWHRTDAGPYIGRIYLENGLGHRVCQVFCDSRNWDTSNYPDGFFDTVLIDGGHQKDTVISDTKNALRLTRDGGLIIWHDFCPNSAVLDCCPSVKGVTEAVSELLPELKKKFKSLYWIEPSWILVGEQRQRN